MAEMDYSKSSPFSYREGEALNTTYASGAVPSYITGTHTGGYDSRNFIYNLKPYHFRKTRAKLAAAKVGVGLAKIVFGGDSTMVGEQAAPYSVNSPAVRARNLMEKLGYPIAGAGMIAPESGASAFDTRFTRGAGWIGAGKNIIHGSTVDSPLTFQSDLTGTVVDVEYLNGVAATCTVEVDDIEVGTITITTSGSTGLFSYSGLADTAHKVVIKHKTGSYSRIVGVSVRKTTGLLLYAVASGGGAVADWEIFAQTSMAYIANGYSPDCIFLDLLTNDVTLGTDVATYKTKLQTTIDRFTTLGVEVCLVSNIGRGNATPDVAYRNAQYELADTNNLPLIDLFDRWGTYATANALGLMFDIYHPKPAGYAEKGEAIIKVLTV